MSLKYHCKICAWLYEAIYISKNIFSQQYNDASTRQNNLIDQLTQDSLDIEDLVDPE
jgi:hypothetical protein